MNKKIISLIVVALILIGCVIFVPKKKVTQQDSVQPQVPINKARVINTYPHDDNAFTQGLIFHNGFLYESTGLRGQSSLRKVKLETGKVLRKKNLHRSLFGEGLAIWQDQFVQLTWHAGKAFRYGAEFKELGTFAYSGEGWGLTTDENSFILSNGSADLKFLDPETFREIRRVTVTYNGKPLLNMNELEYIKGKVYANVWMENKIAVIDPKSGKVTAWIDLDHLVPLQHRGSEHAVLNGIAYDSKNDRLFVTGKLWSKIYEIKTK